MRYGSDDAGSSWGEPGGVKVSVDEFMCKVMEWREGERAHEGGLEDRLGADGRYNQGSERNVQSLCSPRRNTEESRAVV